MAKTEEKKDKCEYCNRKVLGSYSKNDLKLIQIRVAGRWGTDEAWGKAIWACGQCREYLLGVFRYAK